jgi:two-component system response regulator AtoC
MRQLIDSVRRLSPKDVTVLVRGETGTGKEVIASLLHDWSRRSVRRFVRFNCAAIPDELAESALFGHVRGAFTGAVEERRGYFAEADGGTLVLDEVGDLPLTVQGTLLRALQDGEIQRVGAGRTERVDVRVIACTNRDLRAMVEAGRFREDLYYRLAVVELFVPPLRDRREDIPALVAEFARRYARRFGMAELRLSAELVGTLQRAAWPGNVRQLENAVARLAAFSEDGGLPEGIPIAPAPPAGAPGTTPELGAADGEPRALVALDADLTLREQMEVVEREIIARALTRAGGNRSEAARRLALSRSAFHAKLRKLSLAGESDPK